MLVIRTFDTTTMRYKDQIPEDKAVYAAVTTHPITTIRYKDQEFGPCTDCLGHQILGDQGSRYEEHSLYVVLSQDGDCRGRCSSGSLGG